LLVDGIHDLGGMQGFGEVGYSPAEPVFRRRWEAVARALLVVVAGAVKASGGEFRHSIERMEPGHYLTSSYYEHWLTAAATLAVEHGLVTHSELEARAGGWFPLSGRRPRASPRARSDSRMSWPSQRTPSRPFSLSRPTRARHVPAEDPRPGAFVRDRPDRASPRRIKNFSDFPAREAGQPSVTSVTRKTGFHLFSPDLIT
jgi:hypothetical protein